MAAGSEESASKPGRRRRATSSLSSTAALSSRSLSPSAKRPRQASSEPTPCCQLGASSSSGSGTAHSSKEAICSNTVIICCTDEHCDESTGPHGDEQQEQEDNDDGCPDCAAAIVCCDEEDCNRAANVTDCADCVAASNVAVEASVAGANEAVTKPASEEIDFLQCDVPGCTLIEWDEKAVDELLQCCCSSSGAAHYHSFATPYPTAAKQQQTQYTPTFSLSAHDHGAHTHMHRTDGQAPPGSSASNSSSSTSGASRPSLAFTSPTNSSVMSLADATLHDHHHHPFAVQQPSASLPASWPIQEHFLHMNNDNQGQALKLTTSVPATAELSGTAVLGGTEHANPGRGPSAHIQAPGVPSQQPLVFRCQWAGCAEHFATKEAMVGHVNTAHLMYAQPQPQMQEHDVSWSRNASQNQTGVPSGIENHAPELDHFDHSFKCLWDSCHVDLPLLPPATQGFPSESHHTSASEASALTSAASQDTAPTATLVRHLLQDHLHVPSELLGQLTPGLSSQLTLPDYSVQSQTVATRDQKAKPASASESTAAKCFGKNSDAKSSSFLTPAEPFRDGTGAVVGKVDCIRADAKIADVPHECQWHGCCEVFPTTQRLMDHVTSVHVGSGKSMYFCQWKGCERAHEGKGFAQRQKVVRHLRTHVGDKPFVCKICSRSFSEASTLAQHVRTHTNEKPFSCPECGKAFAVQSALTIHMRTHSGEKPFVCPVPGCGMRFTESSNLHKHVKTHDGQDWLFSQGHAVLDKGDRSDRFESVSSGGIMDIQVA